jgi:hypothetical protein
MTNDAFVEGVAAPELIAGTAHAAAPAAAAKHAAATDASVDRGHT